MNLEYPQLKPLPWQLNYRDQPRRVGVEIEMNHVSVERVAALVADHLGLTVEAPGRYDRKLVGDSAGDWVVELDFRFLKELGREPRQEGTLVTELLASAEGTLAWLAHDLVPVELVSPPLPLDRLPEIEVIIALLRAAGAKGTSDALANAFGMQFNPDIPSSDPKRIAAILKAFFCLYAWLARRADIDLARRITTYVNPFPADYVRHVVEPGYWPDLTLLIDDYLAFNPTRNRPLDLLPLFAHLDEKRVRAVTRDPLIKPRPTFHYRLPDSKIDQPEWGFHTAWNDWVEVEWLASDEQRLDECCRAYCQFLAQPLERWFGDWARRVEDRWLIR